MYHNSVAGYYLDHLPATIVSCFHGICFQFRQLFNSLAINECARVYILFHIAYIQYICRIIHGRAKIWNLSSSVQFDLPRVT